MKKLLLLSALGLILLAGCSKEKDDLQKSSSEFTKTEMLTQQTWWVDELYHRLNAGNSHYERGVSNTTGIQYDNLRFTFNENGTGTHVDAGGVTRSFTWQFTTTDERNIFISISGGSSYQWSLVEIAEEALHATVAVTVGGEDVLESFRLEHATSFRH